MNILGIETSCDETAASVVKDGRTILSSSVVATQIEYHKKYSGVVPELASRAHVMLVNHAIEKAVSRQKIDAIAVTTGPGLVGSLLVGKMTAESLGYVWRKPVMGIDHIEGHLLSSVLVNPTLKPPFLGLIVSGGHTELIYAASWGRYFVLGGTRDDAVGEAFDKVAKMMKLGYPGGPVIEKWARKGVASRSPFPYPWLPKCWDFSFSGIKTSVLYKLRTKKSWSTRAKQDLCAGFQESVTEVVAQKALAAAQALKVNQIVVGGGVAANACLRHKLASLSKAHHIRLFLPPISLCTDNAAMIASAAYFKVKKWGFNRLRNLAVTPYHRIPRYKKKIPAFSIPSSQK